ELRLQAHRPESINLAVDVMVTIDQADIPDLGSYLHDSARSLELQIFDDGDAISILQHVSDGVTVNTFIRFGHGFGLSHPFVATLGADIESAAILIGKAGLALGTGG